MKTLKQAVSEYEASGLNKDKARRKAYLDCCYGRVAFKWEADKPLVWDGPRVFIHGPETRCYWCGEQVSEQDAVLQTAYWTPNHYLIGHAECRVKLHQKTIIEQQMIDKDCNDCRHFSGGPTVLGQRDGHCAKFDRPAVAYPGGTFCSYPDHEECFEHRRS